MTEVLEQRRLFSGGLPGIPLRAVTIGGQASTGGSVVDLNTAYPTTDVRTVGATADSAYTQYGYVAEDGGGVATPFNSPSSGFMTPSQMRTAYYGSNVFVYGGITGNGTGQTIAIIDAFDDPSFVSSTDPNFANSDLHTFDLQYNIVDPPSFTKVNQSGGTSYPVYNAGWAGEIALDIEWTHAMAPGASIILVEATTNANNNLATAINYAKNRGDVTVLSMSFGGGDSGDSSTYTNAANKPVTMFASSGDDGSPSGGNSGVNSPANSASVVGVGGTALNQGRINSSFSGAWTTETAWNGSGGGISTAVSKPAYQNLVNTPSSTTRTVPDVAANGASVTAVNVVDTSGTTVSVGLASKPTPNWYGVYGTSESSPVWAGFLAVVDQYRASIGLTPLSGSALSGYSQALPRIYALPASDFHDITSGNNTGYSAGAGYDAVTGRGSPILSSLIPDLAGGVTITGKVFNDLNGDSTPNGSETGIANVAVYLDLYNGSTIVSEVSAVTNASGAYAFTDLVGGAAYSVRLATTPSGKVPTGVMTATATGSFNTTVTQNFGFFPTTLAGANITVQNAPGGTSIQFYTSSAATGSAQYSIAKAQLPAPFAIGGTTGNDVLNVDLTNGDPLSGVTLTYAGGIQSTADTLVVTGSAGSDAVTFGASTLTVGADSMSVTGIEAKTFAGNGGGDALSVVGTTVTLSGSQVLSSLSLSGGSKVTLSSGGNVLYTQALATDASQTLDLTDGKLVYDYSGASPLSTLYPLLSSGYAGGAWSGKGIVSSVAATNALTGVGVAEASDILGLSGPATGTYAGVTVDATTLVLRYTYVGDTDLNGLVDGSDVANALAGLHGGLSGWVNGDVDYGGPVTSADYNAILAVLRTQGAPIT